jgi:hypothetical protein
MRLALVLFAALLGAATASAQPDPDSSATRVSTEPLKLSGPRFGITYLSGDLVDRLNEEFGDDLDAAPVITQFGWQFETRLFVADTGLSGISEFVPLIGGLEQGLFLPSFSFLVGLRTASGVEFGLGPNVSLGGAAYVLAAGVTQQYGGLNIPVNVSTVLSGDGVRLSLLVGFNLAR